jgi:membrane peptidoglycan carboxypeptidase
MERRYSGSPYEEFFTGGGVHHFENFEKEENSKIYSVREAFYHSVNLSFIRLMRDLVSYHRVRLPYDSDDVLANSANAERGKMLQEIAEEESRQALRRAYQNYAKQTPQQIVTHLLGARKNPQRRATILFFAWHLGKSESDLETWLQQNRIPTKGLDLVKLYHAYSNPRLGLTDYAFLLSMHPLDLWCATQFRNDPNLSWEKLYASSAEARRMASAWLLSGRNRRAQDLRLRIRMEKDAFVRMTPYWQKLGFPFKTMVPTYATAIGSSSDRPVALAELVGILVNDGVRRQTQSLTNVHFASGTPYETLFERSIADGEQVLDPQIASIVRQTMTGVVEEGTARRLSGAFKLPDGKPITVGGKTGSGDNRFETFNRYGGVISSRATNRTATFVFYIGERYFGVITAYVQGREAENYRFTSALPVTLLRLLAPTLLPKVNKDFKQPAVAGPASLPEAKPNEPPRSTTGIN